MKAKDFYKNTIEKEKLIEQSINILRTCEYNYHTTYWYEQQMKDIQANWKTIGSAGNQQERLWNQFQSIQNQFWKRIKLMKKEMRRLELSDQLDDLRDEFEGAKYFSQWNKVERLGNIIDEKEDKLMNLEDEIYQLEEELGINI